MKLIVGLGNPGRQYAGTRHNVGFEIARRLAVSFGVSTFREKFNGELAECIVDGTKVAILCPMTFMNASGNSVRKAVDFYKFETAGDDLLVICDDLNLSVGRLRFRRTGSAGGQKGLADIIRQLGTEDVPRLRFGIDRPPAQHDVVDYVLSRFDAIAEVQVEQAFQVAVLALTDWVRQGSAFCMNRYNSEIPKKD